jgi:hypothetical protein
MLREWKEALLPTAQTTKRKTCDADCFIVVTQPYLLSLSGESDGSWHRMDTTLHFWLQPKRSCAFEYNHTIIQS